MSKQTYACIDCGERRAYSAGEKIECKACKCQYAIKVEDIRKEESNGK